MNNDAKEARQKRLVVNQQMRIAYQKLTIQLLREEVAFLRSILTHSMKRADEMSKWMSPTAGSTDGTGDGAAGEGSG